MKRTILTSLVIVIVGAAACAYGGGGFFSGEHLSYPGFASTDHGIEYSGGYGIGATCGGYRNGGFGVVLQSSDDFVGAFGGSIQGRQVRIGPTTFSANLWTGFGYLSPHVSGSPVRFGYLAEATAEVGLTLIPLFQLSIFGGVQAIGALDLARLAETVNCAPVVGGRATWGSF